MSFYFDDDNDDHALSQVFKTSSQKQVTFSQSSSTVLLSQTPRKQSLSQQPGSPSQPFSQKSILSSISNASKQSDNNSQKAFVCQNCGAIDQYYLEHGLVTCSKCFTQSQNFGALQEELDYDETQHMAARNRDGSLRRVGTKKPRARNPDGSFKVGRPAIPLQQLDSSKKPPPLDVCLRGFQSVLQKSCKILCLELLPTFFHTSQTTTATESDSDESNEQSRSKKLHRQVSKTVRNMWKAYLLSWNEGADYYSNLYPQIRFALRDQFLGPKRRSILYKTLAAKAEEKLAQEIREKVKEESDDDDSQNSQSDSDSEDDSYFNTRSKKIKIEAEQDESMEAESLYNFHGNNDATKQIKSENYVSDDEIPIRDVVLSTHRYHDRRPRLDWNTLTEKENVDAMNQQENDDSDSDNDEAEANENFSISSDLSIGDAAEYKRKQISSRKRKRTKEKETKFAAGSTNPFAKMIYFHNRIMHMKTRSKMIPRLGRKEAALLIQPSMELVLVFLLVAASPHGLTEGKLAEWVGNGSLPILNAFEHMLSTQQQKELAMLSSFFTIPKAPDAAVLKFLTRKVHVACGYRAPTVKVIRPSVLQFRKTKGTNSRRLVAAGTLIRPSSVPMILGYLVSELGLSQKVLNYSLALMGLPVSIKALKIVEIIKRGRGRPRKEGQEIDVAADWDDEETPVFDLSKPGERLRKKRYCEKLSRRRRQAMLLREKGVAVTPHHRKKKYCVNVPKQDSAPRKIPGQAKSIESEVPEFVSGQPIVDKEKLEWLPPALHKARPDKLGEVDQILAVVIIACKLIPDWEKNHQYVFSRVTRNNADIGSALDKARDRFVPWNRDEFCRVGNGKTESDYLEFLKECIFRGNRYALPKFVESLSMSASTFHNNGENDRIKEEQLLDEDQSSSSALSERNTIVKPNEFVLGWKKKPRFEYHRPPEIDQMRVPYQPTEYSTTSSVRRPVGPLGALIEYMACKTGTCPMRILDQLLVLDEELASKGKPENLTVTLPPNICYQHFIMGETNTHQATTKRITRSTRLATTKPTARSTRQATAKPTRSDSRRIQSLPSPSPAMMELNQDIGNPFDLGNPFTSAATQEFNTGNDNILAHRFTDNDDLNSVTSIYEV